MYSSFAIQDPHSGGSKGGSRVNVSDSVCALRIRDEYPNGHYPTVLLAYACVLEPTGGRPMGRGGGWKAHINVINQAKQVSKQTNDRVSDGATKRTNEGKQANERVGDQTWQADRPAGRSRLSLRS